MANNFKQNKKMDKLDNLEHYKMRRNIFIGFFVFIIPYDSYP